MMRRLHRHWVEAAIFFVALVAPRLAMAHEQEVGLTMGRFLEQDRTTISGSRFHLATSGPTLQANYGYRLFGVGPTDIYLNMHFNTHLQRLITSPDSSLTRDIATIYVTPTVTVKFFPRKRIVPWVTIGGGFGDYEASLLTLAGQPNGATRNIIVGVFTFGGGVDVPIWRFISARGEVRDFYTGSPDYNSPVRGGQHNVVVAGGLVFRFGKR